MNYLNISGSYGTVIENTDHTKKFIHSHLSTKAYAANAKLIHALLLRKNYWKADLKLVVL